MIAKICKLPLRHGLLGLGGMEHSLLALILYFLIIGILIFIYMIVAKPAETLLLRMSCVSFLEVQRNQNHLMKKHVLNAQII